MSMYAAYELRHIETGAFLYKTTATEEEVLPANANLRERQLPYRFFPEGDFNIPSCHDNVADR